MRPDGEKPNHSELLLGDVSFKIGLASLLFWLGAFGYLAWVIGNRSSLNKGYLIASGFSFFLGAGINLVGVILGTIAVAKKEKGSKAIVGSVINGICCLVLFVIFATGFYVRASRATKTIDRPPMTVVPSQ